MQRRQAGRQASLAGMRFSPWRAPNSPLFLLFSIASDWTSKRGPKVHGKVQRTRAEDERIPKDVLTRQAEQAASRTNAQEASHTSHCSAPSPHTGGGINTRQAPQPLQLHKCMITRSPWRSRPAAAQHAARRSPGSFCHIYGPYIPHLCGTPPSDARTYKI